MKRSILLAISICSTTAFAAGRPAHLPCVPKPSATPGMSAVARVQAELPCRMAEANMACDSSARDKKLEGAARNRFLNQCYEDNRKRIQAQYTK